MGDFAILGTLVVTDDDGHPRRLGGPARRRLLAALLARVGRPVASDLLVEDLWGENPPATADTTLLSHVARLRDDLGRDGGVSPVRTEPGGYSIVVDPAHLDSWCFERDLTAGRTALQSGDPAAALALLDQALSWWRGEAYAEFPDAAFAIHERVRLGELRLQAAELRTDAGLATGQSDSLVPDLEARLLDQPYRERSWEQLVVALYRSGRQAEALGAYQRARTRLHEDLGLDPSPVLRDLERRVLAQDPALGPSTPQVVDLWARGSDVAPVVGSLAVEPHLGRAQEGSREELHAALSPAPACPYLGLASYREDDADVFVGRERLTAELAGRLVDNDLLVVTGSSGAGKTSLVRAGLLPALRAGGVPGSAAWRTQVVSPGPDPMAALASARADLLVVDQAEELFTLADGSARREAGEALAALLHAGTRLVLVLRGDFYGRLAELDAVTRRIGAATVLVGPLTAEETRRVVTEPAAGRGVQATAELADRVVDDVAGRTGALPLLSEALAQAWERRTGDRLTLDDYLAAGGIGGAVEAMAERTFATLGREEQQAARRTLLRTATLTGGTWSRRPCALDDAAPAGDDTAHRAVDALVAGRLLTAGSGTVELAHEALLSAWPRLRAWLDERAAVAAQLDKLESDAAEWDGAGRGDADLLRGPRLQSALEYRAAHPEDFSPRESAYLDASRSAVDAELRLERRRRRRLVAVTVALAVATLLAGTLSVVTQRARTQADSAALSADARRLAAQSTEVPDETTALLLAAASYRQQDSPDSRAALVAALARGGDALWRIRTADRLLWAGAPADGSRILVMDASRTVTVYDATTHAVRAQYRVPGSWVGDLSPDGTDLLVCGPSGTQGTGRAVVVDAATGVTRAVLTTAASEAPGTCGAFTGDGRQLVLAAILPTPGHRALKLDGPADGLAVYDVGQWTAPVHAVLTSTIVTALATGEDAVAVRLADGTLQVRSADIRTVLSTAKRPELATDCASSPCVVALSPDGQHLAYTDPTQPRAPHELSTADLAGRPQVADPMRQDVVLYAFAPDGRRLAVVDGLGSERVMDTSTLGTQSDRVGTPTQVNAAVWLAHGASPELLTAGLDREVVSWDVSALPQLVTLGPSVPGWNADGGLFGSVIAGTSPGPDASTLLFRQDLHTGAVTTWPMVTPANETNEWNETSADGSRIAFTFYDNTTGAMHVVVYDLTDGRLLLDRRWPPLPNPYDTLATTLDEHGTHLVVTTGQDTIQVIDIATGTLVRTLHVQVPGADGAQRWLAPMSADPFGRVIFMAWKHGAGPVQPGQDPTGANGADEQVVAVDPTTGALTGPVGTGRYYPSLSWSADGSRAVIATMGGLLRVVDGRTLQPLTPLVPAVNGYVNAATISPDGSTVLAAGTDGTIAFWDASTLQRLGPPIQITTQHWVWAWYDTDGTVHGEFGDQGSPHLQWFTAPGTPSAWLADACRYAGRDLTQTEWQQYVGARPYRTTCA